MRKSVYILSYSKKNMMHALVAARNTKEEFPNKHIYLRTSKDQIILTVHHSE